MTVSFKDAKKYQFLTNVEQRQNQTQQQFLSACQSTFDVYANWQGYVANETVTADRDVSYLEFAAANRELVDAVKTNLAYALDVIAGGCVDVNGDPLSRQDLLDELAAVPAQS